MTPNWFVAWPLQGAAEWLATLEKNAPGGLHFLAPPDLHVTLAFLGRYEASMVPKISGLLRSLPWTDLEISPGDCTALPQPRRFSAVAFTVGTGRTEIEKHITKWRDRICREAGARLETRAALPHFTVARPDRRIGSEDRDAVLAWIDGLPSQSAIRLRLEKPRLFTWTEPGSARRYRPID